MTFQYTVTDGALTSDVQTVTINVTLPAVPPPSGNGGGSGGGSSGGTGGGGGGSNSGGDSSGKSGGDEPRLPVNVPVGLINATLGSSRSLTQIASSTSDQDASGEASLASVSALNLDTQPFAALNFAESNSILSNTILLSGSHSAVARLSAEQTERLAQDLAHTIDAFARLDDDHESPLQIFAMKGVELVAKTAIGSGVVVWVMHISQVMAALLAASSAWTHIDPLSILNASKEALAKDSSDIAETLFDDHKQ